MNSQLWFRWDDRTLELRVKAQPRSKTNQIAGVSGDALVVRINAIPENGRANQTLLRLLADAFSVPKQNVHISRGIGSRIKTVRIEQPRTIPVHLAALIGVSG